MEPEVMDAVRQLAEFAEKYAERVYKGDPEQMQKTNEMLEAAELALSYLDAE